MIPTHIHIHIHVHTHMRNQIHTRIYTNINLSPMMLMMVMMKTLHGCASGDDHDHKNYSYIAAGARPLVLAPFGPSYVIIS